MQSFLERVELEKYFPAMKSLGVKSLSDFDQVQSRPPQCCRVLHNAPQCSTQRARTSRDRWMLKVCLPLQVEDRDLDAIGMSTLKKRRFRRGLQEEHDGVGFAERLSPIAQKNINFEEGQLRLPPCASVSHSHTLTLSHSHSHPLTLLPSYPLTLSPLTLTLSRPRSILMLIL